MIQRDIFLWEGHVLKTYGDGDGDGFDDMIIVGEDSVWKDLWKW